MFAELFSKTSLLAPIAMFFSAHMPDFLSKTPMLCSLFATSSFSSDGEIKSAHSSEHISKLKGHFFIFLFSTSCACLGRHFLLKSARMCVFVRRSSRFYLLPLLFCFLQAKFAQIYYVKFFYAD